MIPRNLAAVVAALHPGLGVSLSVAWLGAALCMAPLAAAQASAAVQASVPAPVTATPAAIPARPLPASPAFTYLRPARPMPRAQPNEELLLILEQGKTRLPLTLRQLMSMPAVRYRVAHPQLGRTLTYEGVPLRDLAVLGGFAGRDLQVYASNGFMSTIRASDYLNFPIMLAYAADNRPIPVLQKGPLTVVLPATPARFHAGPYSAAWVWFAERITPAP